MTRIAHASLIVFGAALAACVLPGCGSMSASSIKGRVVEGPAPIVKMADNNDTLVKSQGIPGVDIRIDSMSRSGEAHLVGTATSGDDGSFSVPISDRELIKNDMVLTARQGGVPALRERVMLPGEGRQVIVLLPQRTPPTAPAKEKQ